MRAFKSFLSNSKIDFMRVHKIALIMSIISIILSLLLVFAKGLNLGIDFSGGILIEAKVPVQFDTEILRKSLEKQIDHIQVQNIDSQSFAIRVPKAAKDNVDQSIIIKNIQENLAQNFSNIEYRKIDYVGPQVGVELIKKGFLALFLSFAFIMIYIWIRFDWQFGVGGIFALLHDAMLVMGFYAVSGIEFNLTSIAAILTVIGYSINDSVVIYDRIRENLRLNKKADLTHLINSSINSTLSRTILTSSATLLSLLALVLFGGEALKSFSIASFFGILIGTYSSIYISAPILLYFDPRKSENKKS